MKHLPKSNKVGTNIIATSITDLLRPRAKTKDNDSHIFACKVFKKSLDPYPSSHTKLNNVNQHTTYFTNNPK